MTPRLVLALLALLAVSTPSAHAGDPDRFDVLVDALQRDVMTGARTDPAVTDFEVLVAAPPPRRPGSPGPA